MARWREWVVDQDEIQTDSTPMYFDTLATPSGFSKTRIPTYPTPLTTTAYKKERKTNSLSMPDRRKPMKTGFRSTSDKFFQKKNKTNDVVQAPIVHAAPIGAPVTNEYNIQDQSGQYSFGYQDPHSVKQEVKTADGVVRGAHQYIDTNGTNLPVASAELPTPVQDTPEVAAAKQAHFEAIGAAAAAAAAEPATVIYNADPLPIVPAYEEGSGKEVEEAPKDDAPEPQQINIPIPDNAITFSNVESIPAFENLPPVPTYSQQIYYGAAAAPATITYGHVLVAVPVVKTAPVAPTPAAVNYVQAPL